MSTNLILYNSNLFRISVYNYIKYIISVNVNVNVNVKNTIINLPLYYNYINKLNIKHNISLLNVNNLYLYSQVYMFEIWNRYNFLFTSQYFLMFIMRIFLFLFENKENIFFLQNNYYFYLFIWSIVLFYFLYLWIINNNNDIKWLSKKRYLFKLLKFKPQHILLISSLIIGLEEGTSMESESDVPVIPAHNLDSDSDADSSDQGNEADVDTNYNSDTTKPISPSPSNVPSSHVPPFTDNPTPSTPGSSWISNFDFLWKDSSLNPDNWIPDNSNNTSSNYNTIPDNHNLENEGKEGFINGFLSDVHYINHLVQLENTHILNAQESDTFLTTMNELKNKLETSDLITLFDGQENMDDALKLHKKLISKANS